MTGSTSIPESSVDVAIVGGGIAGLWLANLLTRRGYGTVLLEADRLGGGQTLASQGMIHGGLKYALSGHLTGASEAIADMPQRWARCLDGAGEIDLRGLEPLSGRYYMFAGASTLGRLTGLFASRALRGRIRRLTRDEYPPALADPGFHGVVYELNDFVLDTAALVTTLHQGIAQHAYRYALQPGQVRATGAGVTLDLGATTLHARTLLLSAGAGNGALLEALGISEVRMQRRPLHQAVVRHRHLPALFAHCLTGIRRAEPRLTITSHRDGDGWLWYLGGQLASDGVAMTDAELGDHARRELTTCLPWIDWQGAELSTLRIDRAEPAQDRGRRPDEAFARAVGGATIVAWPTKLSLVPDLGDKVLPLLPAPAHPRVAELPLSPAAVGQPPWGP